MNVTSGKRPSPRRILLYGQHGCGKSTWAANAPGAIFLNIEDGLNDIDCDKTDHLTSFAAVHESLTWLRTNSHHYKTVVIDTIDWVEQLIFRDIASAAGVASVADIDYGKGAPRAIPKWQYLLELLNCVRREKRMGVILLAHARLEKVANPEGTTYDRYAPDLWTNNRNEGVGNMVQEWCDEVLFARFKQFVRTEGKGFNERGIAKSTQEREILTSESSFALAKNRLNLPRTLPMEWPAYVAYVAASYAKPQAVAEIPPPGQAIIETNKPSGVDISGIVVDGSSKKQSPLVAEMETVFGG